MKTQMDKLVWVGFSSALALLLGATAFLVEHWLGGFDHMPLLVWDWAIVIGVSSLAAFVLVGSWLPVGNRRPFNYVPLDAAPWEYLVFGATFGTSTFGAISILLGTFIVLPLLVPVRVVMQSAVGLEVTVTGAVAALPSAWLGTAALFCYIYAIVAKTGWGTLEAEGRKLFVTAVPRYRDLVPAFQFSLAALINSPSTDVKASAGAQWVALAESVFGKVLEVVTVSVGVALVIQRLR